MSAEVWDHAAAFANIRWRMMFGPLRNPRFYIILAADSVIFFMALVVAYLLRFDFNLEALYIAQLFRVLPFFLAGKILIFLLFGLYRGMWRYTSMLDLWRLVQACMLSVVINVLAVNYFYSLNGFPRSVYLLDGLLTFVMCGGMRVSIRFLFLFRHKPEILQGLSFLKSNKTLPKRKSVLIVGAGQAAEKIIREIVENPHLQFQIPGLLDDDPAKWGRRLHGLKVFGGVELLPRVLERVKVDEVLITIPSATGAQMQRIVEICKKCAVRYRTLPEIGGIISGKVSIKKLRDVRYEDLLRRTPISLDVAEISRYLKGKRVLVTGAGGSIGSELCRQMINFDLERLIMVDSSELNIYNVQMEMAQEMDFHNYHGILGQVQDRALMDVIFTTYRPHVVFHAAAYKHVPMLEKNPWEAIFNNVLGSQVVMELALKYAVERFVLVSTDKAVRPTNVMGASKRLTELILQSIDGNGTRFMAVRFGNVAGSSGSVLTIFRRQLEQGGPITVTHPEMTRYFMTIPEAAQLILQAGTLGDSGKIFILEMGKPVKIKNMAEDLVRLSGKELGNDVEIIFTGLREGEKLYEELISQGEGIMDTRYEKIMVLQSNGGWNGKKNQVEFKRWLDRSLEELYRIASTYDAHGIKSKLCEIVPEYTPEVNIKSVLDWDTK